MNRATKIIAVAACAAVVAAVPAFAACSSGTYVTSIEATDGGFLINYSDGTTKELSSSGNCVSSVEKTGETAEGEIYTVFYSDGTSLDITVPSGENGVSVNDIYNEYVNQTGDDITFADFVAKYLTLGEDGVAASINYCLQSSMKLYCEFITPQYSAMGWPLGVNTSVYTGAAIIYDMDKSQDGYTYIVTNYHVVYNTNAIESENGGSKIANKIVGYLYGSEGTPQSAGTDNKGYTQYSYGDYAIPLEYVGGSINYDVAVLRASTEDILAVNEYACEVELADEYYVGETAIAIGNPEDAGLSVTRGVISTVNEQISLKIDNVARIYRSMRIDTPLYSGNSGGGLFNAEGKLIGITNSGNSEDQNINYAVPLEIVTGVANNIIYFYNDGNSDTSGLNTPEFGLSVSSSNSKYIYDETVGYGEIYESVTVNSVVSESIAEKCGVETGDVILAVSVNGVEKPIKRAYDIEDLLFTLRPGDTVAFTVEHGGENVTTESATLEAGNFELVG